MKNAARAAGYRGTSDQSLCNSGRKILNKLSKNPNLLLFWPGAREMRIARLIANTVDNGTAQQQLKILKILANFYY